MTADAATLRREELTKHLARSRKVQRRAVEVALVLGAIAVVLLGVGVPARYWLTVAAVAVSVGGSGVWITQGHIADFKKQLGPRFRG